MEQYYRITVKNEFEDKKGNLKYKKENYLVYALTPSEAEKKLERQLGGGEYEIIGINVSNIVDVIR